MTPNPHQPAVTVGDVLDKMNERIREGDGVDYDYYGEAQHGSHDEGFTLAQALTALIKEAEREARIDELNRWRLYLTYDGISLFDDRIATLTNDKIGGGLEEDSDEK